MGSTTTTELGLDLTPTFTLKAVDGFLRRVGVVGDGDSRVAKMEEYVRGLEEERRKIEAFKRELPLCMVILTEVIDGLKEEMMQCRGEIGNGRPILEQFLPIKSKFDEEGGVKPEKDNIDKMNWMSSAQLWSDNYSDCNTDANSNTNTTGSRRNTEERGGETDRQSESGNPFAEEIRSRSGGGAFLPFKGLSGAREEGEEEKVTMAVPDLSLLTPGFKHSRPVSRLPEEHRSCGSSSKGKSAVSQPSSNAQSNLQGQQQQASRKARRCWSPELHRRFVSALQQLGGSQATPKQIRELMKVDGLTNDEVKSHLQKYRLHTRRLTPASSSPAASQPMVLLGGLWVSSSDQYPVSKPSNLQSGSPPGPLQLASGAGGAARGGSTTGGDSCEEEDGKSESYSWKGHTQRSCEEEAD